jgi:heat shock transcription factor, other eukaryote
MPPQANSRKRPAPGASPTMQQQQQTSLHLPPRSSSPRLTDDQFFKWGQGTAGNTPSYPDTAAAYNGALYHGIGGLANMTQVAQIPNNQHPPQAPSSPSNQVARRSVNQSLVSRGRTFNSSTNSSTPWPGDFGDGAGLELQGGGWISNSEEQLEQKALIAKREAQAKRKQIPPFVQKLSRYDLPLPYSTCVLTRMASAASSTSQKIRIS